MATGDNGRTSRGRFAKGCGGGPGNPFARRVAELRRALLDAVTEEELVEVVRRLVDMAKAGDVAAAKLVLAYAVGRPAPAVDPDTLDLQEMQLLQRTPVNFDELVGPLQGLPAGKACAIIRAMIPVISRHWADRFAERLEGDWPAAGADPGAGR